ncbi:hypothetical protein LTR85_004735 [Meristemomyces frigidus]|nr:hypothetical protein LTR85_004735 [Meristemomyces frigidus]
MNSMAFWSRGGCVCYPSELFDAGAVISAIQDEKLTNLPAVPTMMNAILAHPSLTKAVMASLLDIELAGSVVSPDSIKKIISDTGVGNIATNFGMSEAMATCSIPFGKLPYEHDSNTTSAGFCPPGAKVRICSPDSRTVLEHDMFGELHVGGSMVSDGYLGYATGQHYVDDGSVWLPSGDQAKMALNGEVFIMGRYKDLIIRGGENMSPASIEAVIDTMAHTTSQVIGIKDEVAGEVPLATIKQASGAANGSGKVREVVRQKLGPAFIPAHVVIIEDLGLDDFPKTDSGKIQKAHLEKIVAEQDVVGSLSTARDAQEASRASDMSSTSYTLQSIWSSLLGISMDELTPSTHIDEMADSITMMRAANNIERRVGQCVTLKDLIQNPTISGQTALLRTRAQTGAHELLTEVRQRKGPPAMSDMIHTLGSPARHQAVQKAFAVVAADMGLSWEQDVEDVMPIWDFGHVLLKRLRQQSWNHRHAYVATRASSKVLRAALERALSNQPMLRTLAI